MSLALCLGLARVSFALDEAKIHVAGTPNITSFVYHVGKEKGFYREEGIELQPIMAGMLQGIQGLIGGSFDYSQMLGQGGGAIMRGAPLKIIMAFDTRPSWFLLGTKNMKSIQDLKGKQLAVSSFGAALDQMTRELLPRFGMEPMRDVILRAIEPPPNRLAALLSGAVDAAVLTHPETIIARRQGFNELIFFGDHIDFVSAGVVATERNISQKTGFRPPFYPRSSQDVLLDQGQRKRSRRQAGQSDKVFRGRRPGALPDRDQAFFAGRHHTSNASRRE